MNYGLIGEKLGHSFSKEIHESFAPYTYDICEIAKDDLDSFMTSKAFNAINVTIPYKEKVIPYLTYIDDKAKLIGAVNTIVNKNGELYGYNTDFDGMRLLLQKNKIIVKNKKVLILGTGGTSKTAYAVSKYLGAKDVFVVSRSGELNYENVKQLHSDAEIIINTTPCGMYPNVKTQAITLDGFTNLQGVCDVVYNPLKTQLLLEAEQKNINCCDGLYMLVAQAVLASEYFVDTKYDNSVYSNAYSMMLKQKRNIVLVGMPGCGKSTLGKEIAAKLNLSFVDTDDLVENKIGCKIVDYISQYGEKAFRDIESSVIEEISLQNGYVIATGGGAVLRDENVDNLKRNGKIIFLNRPIDDIVPTSSRPLSSNREALAERFKERFPIYKRVMNAEVLVKGPIHITIERILRII